MNHNLIKKLTSGALLISMAAYTAPILAFTKDETVYSKLDNNGSIKETIVNNHLKNIDGDETLNDLTDLLNIVNVGGDESFKQDGNELVWKAKGNDIYYQGKSKKDLPIEIKIKYELNGKEVDPKDIVGKSGKVKITIEYINHDSHEAYINNKYETLYTPFVVVCGTIINNADNKNITVSTGKVVDNGNQSYVVGIALPGMQESLGIDKSKIEIPNKVEISLESSNFELGNILTYATPKIIEDKDLHLVDKLDSIFNKLDTLQSSSEQLKNGASELSSGAIELSNGAQTFSSKSHEFNQALNLISNGTSTVNSSYSLIDDGIGSVNSGATKLQSGAEKLNTGINTLTNSLSALPESIATINNGTSGVVSGLDTLSAGVDSLIESSQSTATTLGTTLSNIVTSSDNSIAVLNANNQSLQAAINSLDPTTQADIISGLEAQIEDNNSAITSYTTAKAEAGQGLANLQAASLNGQNSITALQNGFSNIKSVMSQIDAGVTELNVKSQALPENLIELSAGSNAIAAGTTELAEGTTNLSDGSTQLRYGINSLDENTQKLADANNQLTDGADTLSEGASKLSDGAKTLSDGMTKFDNEGIKVIYNFVNGNVKGLASRVKKLKELSKDYNNFTMLNNDDNGEVKFVYVIDSLKNDNDNKNDEIIIEDKKKN